jgi:pimeloyl-ACP methyl ester carboxylesterase
MPIAADLYYHAYHEENILPVVLIHGAGGNHLYWPSEIRRLAGFRMYALDLPAHGKSGGRARQSIESYTGTVIAWLEAIGLHNAVFIGHSMGGAIVQTLALNHPQHVLGLGLIASGARLRVAQQLLDLSASSRTFYNAIDEVIACSFSERASDKLKELATERMGEVRPSVLHSDFLACDDFDERERLSDIQEPTIVICGTEDKMTPLRFSQYLVDNILESRLEVIPDAGHMVMLEKPQEVAQVLTAFLEGILY